MLKVFGSPSRYLQGPQALNAMGPYLARLGSRAVLIADRAVLDLIATRVRDVCKAAGVDCEPVEFSGEIIPREVDRLSAVARGLNPSFIIGAGGGKGQHLQLQNDDGLGCKVGDEEAEQHGHRADAPPLQTICHDTDDEDTDQRLIEIRVHRERHGVARQHPVLEQDVVMKARQEMHAERKAECQDTERAKPDCDSPLHAAGG